MNNIVFAGDVGESEEFNFNRRYLEIIYAPQGGSLKSGGKTLDFSGEGAFVIPALKKREYAHSPRDISVLIEQGVFPFKEAARIAADAGGGLGSACAQAAVWYVSEARGREGVLNSLGALIASYVYALSRTAFSPVVESVMAAIEKNAGNSAFSLEDYIRTLPLNYDYVRKLFARETGVTPHEFLVKTRIERAKSIIQSGVSNRYSNFSVSQIAEAGGFSDPLYFSRVFKKYCGVPPSEYIARVSAQRDKNQP